MKLWVFEYVLPTTPDYVEVIPILLFSTVVTREWFTNKDDAIKRRHAMRANVLGRNAGKVGAVVFSTTRKGLLNFLSALEKSTPFEDDTRAPSPPEPARSAK